MACVNQTRPHYVNQMEKTQSNDLAERHGRGTAWEQHGNGMVGVNPPLGGSYCNLHANAVLLTTVTAKHWKTYY
jgi:hypothetical protein